MRFAKFFMKSRSASSGPLDQKWADMWAWVDEGRDKRIIERYQVRSVSRDSLVGSQVFVLLEIILQHHHHWRTPFLLKQKLLTKVHTFHTDLCHSPSPTWYLIVISSPSCETESQSPCRRQTSLSIMMSVILRAQQPCRYDNNWQLNQSRAHTETCFLLGSVCDIYRMWELPSSLNGYKPQC